MMNIMHTQPISIEPFTKYPLDEYMYMNRMNTDIGIVYRLGLKMDIKKDFRVPDDTYEMIYKDNVDVRELEDMITNEIMNYGNELLVYNSKNQIYELLINEVITHMMQSGSLVTGVKLFGYIDILCDRNVPDDVIIVSPNTAHEISKNSDMVFSVPFE